MLLNVTGGTLGFRNVSTNQKTTLCARKVTGGTQPMMTFVI